MRKAKGLGAINPEGLIETVEIERRDVGKNDVLIEILYCGICHSDCHVIKNEWNSTVYPVVAGHEIIGRIKEVGSGVTNFKENDLVAVGCIIGSCEKCESCNNSLEQYCDKGFTLVFNTFDKSNKIMNHGGFSNEIVTEAKYVIPIPESFRSEDLPRVAPLLCAGITTYSPLKHFGAASLKKVAILGLGGLGHMGVKMAKAMGSEVSIITHSQNKALKAKDEFGIEEVIVSSSSDWFKAHTNKFDIILSTVSAPLDLNQYLSLLKTDGVFVQVGIPGKPFESIFANSLIPKRRSIAGSLIGSIKETKEMIEFALKHSVLADIELVSANHINEAFDRLLKSDVHYRFVIDMKTL